MRQAFRILEQGGELPGFLDSVSSCEETHLPRYQVQSALRMVICGVVPGVDYVDTQFDHAMVL